MFFAAKAAFATFTPPLQYDLQLSAEKHNSITHAAATTGNLDAATPLRSADTELQSTRYATHYCRTHIAWMQQFQCTKCLNTCKTQKHSIIKEEETSPGTISSTAPAIRDTRGHARTRANKFSAVETPLPNKNTLFPANPHTQIASMTRENKAFLGGILQIRRVEDVKTKRMCEPSFQFQKLKI